MYKFFFLLCCLWCLLTTRAQIICFGHVALDESQLNWFGCDNKVPVTIGNDQDLIYFAKIEKIKKILCVTIDESVFYRFDTREEAKQIFDANKDKKNCAIKWYSCVRKPNQ